MILRCHICGLFTIKPIPSSRFLDKYYSNFDYKTGFLNELLIREDAEKTLQNLDKLITHKGDLYDIGCGGGFFLDEARSHGWKVIGIDKSRIISNYVRNHLKLTIINGDILKSKLPENTFDAVTLIQTIEHFTNPRKLLKKVYQILRPGGVIIVSTPNIDSFLAKIQGKNYNYFIPPEHIYYYSPITLSKILEHAGYKVMKVRTYGYSADLAAIIKGKREYRLSNIELAAKITQHNNSAVKQLKNLLFDKIFCCLFYRILNIGNRGSMVEIYAKK